MKDWELIAEISEVLFGYREAPKEEILNKLQSLMVLESTKDLIHNRDEIRSAALDLSNLLDDCGV